MKIYSSFLAILFLLVTISCREESKSKENHKVTASHVESSQYIQAAWIAKRVQNAKSRLEQSEAGKIVWNAMEAHGGLDKWYNNGALAFRFNYQPLDGSTKRDSYQVIDTWSNRARHTSITDTTAHFGWNGRTAWVQAKDSTSFAYDTKFWALTPIYFLGQPFILDGEGVNLELLPQQLYNEKNNDVVKVTFDAGTGDAPDDYYILYFDADSHRLSVIRYIVSYPAYFKDGGHLPEKFMDLSDYKTVDGIIFPTSYKTHWLGENNRPGEYITKIEVSDIEFKNTIEQGFFDAPEGAKILE
jgi:hypothetical protein